MTNSWERVVVVEVNGHVSKGANAAVLLNKQKKQACFIFIFYIVLFSL